MLRLTYLIRRKSGLEADAFRAALQERFASTLAASAGRLRLSRAIFVQTLDDPMNEALARPRGDMEAPYDGVIELWWATDEDADAGTNAAADLVEREAAFIDHERSPLWLNCEYPQINPAHVVTARAASPLVKLYFPLRQQASLSDDAAREHWLRQHGPIIRAHAAGMGMVRYMQVHRVDTPLERRLREQRGTATPAYLGHAETWLDRSMASAPEARLGGRAAIADEKRFIDFARSSIWVGKERIVFDRR
tara:strand:+ start:1341 stop:2090 length:750 start_codon:yes stop_codon:yes gene_type:complete